MANVLNISNFGDGNRIKQGDLSEIRYLLKDANHDDLDLTGKAAVVYLMNRQNEVVYKQDVVVTDSDGDAMVVLTIDEVIPSGTYTLEIVVDEKYVFPSDRKEKVEVVESVLGKAFKQVSKHHMYGELIDYGLKNNKFESLKGDSITITNKYIDEDGNTFIQFSDGTSINISKGVDGKSFTYEDLTDEQKQELANLVPNAEVSDEQVVNIMKKDFIKNKGNIAVYKVPLVDEKKYGYPVTWDIYYDEDTFQEDYLLPDSYVEDYINQEFAEQGGYDGFAGENFNPAKYIEYLKSIGREDSLPLRFEVSVKEEGIVLQTRSNLETPINMGNQRKVSYVFNGYPIEEKSLIYNEKQEE